MKYCPNCGHELKADDRFCPNCGQQLTVESKTYEYSNNATYVQKPYNSTIALLIKIFMLISTIASGFLFFVPLAWTIPMTVIAWRKLDNNEPISLAFKVCTLIFVNLVAGILLLTIDEVDK